MEINYKAIGLRIKKARKKKKLTQGALAEMVEVTPTHISHIENGATKLGLPTIVDIANALDTTVDRLLCDSLGTASQEYKSELSDLLEKCSHQELIYLEELIPHALAAFQKAENSPTKHKEG